MKPIKYFDMFAGVGGFRTGLTNVGDFFVPVGWCEIDRYAQKAYRALYPASRWEARLLYPKCVWFVS